MQKKAVLAAFTLMLAMLLTGCVQGDVTTPEETVSGVDIVVPYATTTPAPVESVMPDAVHITKDGKVVVNDKSVLETKAEQDTGEDDASGYTQLRFGDMSAAVSEMQKRLAELGYYEGGISGVFDDATEKSVKLFEKGYSIMQTGIATAELQKKLYSQNALEYGCDEYNAAVDSYYERLDKDSTGSNVIALQRRLQELGYPITEITGVYDEATRKAVRKFYKAYGYKPRDYAIIDLQKELFSENAKRYNQDAGDAADTSSEDFTLKSGDTGTRVKQLQLRLCELGYMTEATGEYDQATIDAVSAFQTASRLEASGVATADLQKEIYSSSATPSGKIKQVYALLQWGDSGDAVINLQLRFIELGYYSGEADGVFSDEMVAVVKRFQYAAGVEETGVATVDLQELAYSENAPVSAAKAAEAQEDAAAAQTVISPLMSGDGGDEVTKLQSRLLELGYYTGAADGKFGSGTEKAVKKLQRALGVSDTGEASSDLINIALSAAAPKSGEKYWDDVQAFAAISRGDSGDNVVELQKRLWQLGYLDKDDIADSIGTCDASTASAVNAVLKKLGCQLRDGRASGEFLAYLYSDAADKVKK